ncbi:YitT family protein [Caldalkalibacillus mannanilyticus]|uniref:YitT family protein n=1 Tax=Caldalkalibacillus mannanilyticus TaxID=1418 RepID=UPI00046A972D|nr:YitT family protein [Caldalkalibacillus mannanilyticus]
MVRQLLVTIGASVLVAFALNMFLLPHQVLIGGVTGIGMIIGLLTDLNTGWVIFALNVPIFIFGMLTLGKRFIALSVVSVFVTSFAMQFFPVQAVTTDPIIAAVFGGVIGGLAIGIIIRHGGSTGGMDIIGLIMTQKRDFPLGAVIFALNGIVIFISGFLFDWDLALYTLVSIFVTGRVIDAIHTKHIKLTLMIISAKGEEIKDELLSNVYRGITVVDGEGAYSKEQRKILFTVITRYELSEIKEMIQKIDPCAFVNITETVEVMGMFRK